MRNILRVAVQVLGQVLDEGRSLDGVLGAVWREQAGLTPHERAVIQDVSYGVLRQLTRLDAMIDALLTKPLTEPVLRQLLRIALYQLGYTRTAPHAVVDHAVEMCAALGVPRAKGLVNAVLRNFQRRRDAVLAAADASETGRYAHPQWWIDRVRAQYPDRWQAVLDADNQHAPMTLRVNCRVMTRAAYLAELEAAGMPGRALAEDAIVLTAAAPVDRLPRFREGAVSVQDASAQRAARYLDPAPGARVLDACSAPGGKAAHLLERAALDLTAIDRNVQRLDRIRENLGRLSLAANVIAGDAAVPAGWWDGVPYDAILADVPCSSSGVVRRHPDIKWLRRPDDIPRYARRQAAILDALWQTLRRGGKLLYATCSVFQEENALQIARFLERHHDARHLPLPGDTDPRREPAGQILPDADHDGFFYALLQKL